VLITTAESAFRARNTSLRDVRNMMLQKMQQLGNKPLAKPPRENQTKSTSSNILKKYTLT